MPSFYHGSYSRYAKDLVVRLGKDLRNGWGKITRRRGSASNPKRDVEGVISAAIAQGGERAGRVALDDAITKAESGSDPRELHYLASALERFSAFHEAYELRARAHALLDEPAVTGPAWDGQPLSGGKLVITPMRYDRQSLSYPIQYASMIGQASERAPGCIVYLDPRLISLFARSFPKADFRSQDAMPDDPCSGGALHASLDQLPALFATSSETILALHQPLIADPERTAELRRRYAPEDRLLIGLAWGSTNTRKDVPSFAQWATALSNMPGTFISLQYGDTDPALKRMQDLGGPAIISDPKIDQMVDMDAFAAQLAATDVVLTISNTGAHLAGAMGRPSVVLLDDRFHLTWPYFHRTTPWYPKAQLMRRQSRDWSRVLDEARSAICDG